MDLRPEDTKIKTLGECNIDSPIATALKAGHTKSRLVSDKEKIRFRIEIHENNVSEEDIGASGLATPS